MSIWSTVMTKFCQNSKVDYEKCRKNHQIKLLVVHSGFTFISLLFNRLVYGMGYSTVLTVLYSYDA